MLDIVLETIIAVFVVNAIVDCFFGINVVECIKKLARRLFK